MVRCSANPSPRSTSISEQVTSPDQCQQHRDRRGLEARAVPAWWIVAAELDAQVDQQPGPSTQEPVTGELPIGPDRPDELLVDLPLDREPGQRPNLLTLAALPPDPLAGQEQLGTMADRPGGGHRFLVAALQEHLPAGQGRRDGQGRGPVGALGGPLEVLGHRHHQVMVVRHLRTASLAWIHRRPGFRAVVGGCGGMHALGVAWVGYRVPPWWFGAVAAGRQRPVGAGWRTAGRLSVAGWAVRRVVAPPVTGPRLAGIGWPMASRGAGAAGAGGLSGSAGRAG
jgi:hypothetical protein